jgi:hypothetical protein
LTANLALPGAGSLAAGRAVGYGQMACAFLGLIVTLVTGIPMFQWALSILRNSQSSMNEPFENLLELWRHACWPLAGIGLFVVAILWAMATSRALLAGAPKETRPPLIHPPL